MGLTADVCCHGNDPFNIEGSALNYPRNVGSTPKIVVSCFVRTGQRKLSNTIQSILQNRFHKFHIFIQLIIPNVDSDFESSQSKSDIKYQRLPKITAKYNGIKLPSVAYCFFLHHPE